MSTAISLWLATIIVCERLDSSVTDSNYFPVVRMHMNVTAPALFENDELKDLIIKIERQRAIF